MASVKDYYPGDFWGDVNRSLAWLYSRQNAAISGWQADALATATTPSLAECGIVSTPDVSAFAQIAFENIVISPPAGVAPDASSGPDGFPVNFSPQGLPTGNLFLNVLASAASQPVSGYCFSLLQPAGNYRVDVYSRTDQFYYQGGSALTDLGPGAANWGPVTAAPGVVIAVLYPATATPPSIGAGFATLPTGWFTHSNLGVGTRLSSYFARIYSKTDIEYLQEDNIPIVVQDAHHARAGSSVIPATGTLTMHVIYDDPVAGPVMVYSSLQSLAAYQSLVRSFTVPTSDPLYVPDVTASNDAALQNRSFIYDDALAIIAFSVAGNFTAAAKIWKQLNYLLDNPGYLASLVLENAEDGSTARWTPGGTGTVTNLNDPTEPPYGTGNVLKFHAATAGDSFTYAGSGFPDSSDGMLQFEHRQAEAVTFSCDIGVTSAAAKVTKVSVTSGPAGAANYNASTKTITVPIGAGGNTYRTNLLNLASLVSSLAADTLSSITSFKATLTAAGDLYFDNFSVGTLQPANSLSFSYDIYYGQIDQAYIRAGAMAWVAFAYSIYMAMSLDFTPALYLQRMLSFLLTLVSAASDLTNGLVYLGYGKYQDPGYQFIPSLQASVSTEHNVDAYFAFTRAANLLPTAATALLKTGAITGAQAASLNATAATVSAAAATIAAKLTANLYIAPGTDPGHFAQGASSSGLDTSQALDASGTWAAMFCHAISDDTKATECMKFVYQKFYLQNQQIVLSSASASYNEAYQQLQTFSGFKPYNDSAGGYSGSPAVVWQEGSWGMIAALLRLYSVSTVASYFATVEGGLDAFLTKLISSQFTVRTTTGDGSYLNYSLASRGLPFEFTVWPALSSTAWFWITAMNPGLLLSASTDTQSLPYLIIPNGQSQSVSELDGASTLGRFDIQTIDPGGVLKSLAAQQNLIGKIAYFKLGFPGEALGDFVRLHTLQIVSTGFTSDGRLTFDCTDLQRFLQGAQLWLNGGPGPWVPYQTATAPTAGRAVLANAYPVSDANPRWLAGNPLDIYLAALQNELGVGQDPSLPESAWTIYIPGQDSTLINPNPYLDVPGILAMRNGPFSGDRFEFKITRPVDAKSWLEDEILKVLGLYTIVRADGRLSLKSMKPASTAQPVLALNQKNIVGIPSSSRLPVVNVVTVRMSVDDSVRETAARQYTDEITFEQADSIEEYQQEFKQQIEADGLRLNYGGNLRAFLLADRIFRRHAFGTPVYEVTAFLSTVVVELGDLVWLNHPLVPDLLTGTVGLTNVVCEVIDRQPDYARGSMKFQLLDTRFTKLTRPFLIAPLAAHVPVYTSATAGQRSTYMFMSFSSTGGLNADGTPGNTIF
ncbi:MAG TPA: hypothetical protein VKU44_07145 [Terriglobia bacterium]|nr:hypothetical protein [Terriglobia bacterium]